MGSDSVFRIEGLLTAAACGDQFVVHEVCCFSQPTCKSDIQVYALTLTACDVCYIT